NRRSGGRRMSHKATNWLSGIPANLIGASEFRILFHLCYCHNPSKGCFPTQAYLRGCTGSSNGTVNNALNALEAK
ncbi:helix-turn-helix domain-containing protein, partial [Falsihalocynthiibacter sp. S25ZX9]|uniref:helix-turn-helix domain-containing protein n=1 Tax=Falsihalocynthiibacter sp. S25ZX9 TaxID=3240870 RepID=UPI003510B8B7